MRTYSCAVAGGWSLPGPLGGPAGPLGGQTSLETPPPPPHTSPPGQASPASLSRAGDPNACPGCRRAEVAAMFSSGRGEEGGGQVTGSQLSEGATHFENLAVHSRPLYHSPAPLHPPPRATTLSTCMMVLARELPHPERRSERWAGRRRRAPRPLLTMSHQKFQRQDAVNDLCHGGCTSGGRQRPTQPLPHLL